MAMNCSRPTSDGFESYLISHSYNIHESMVTLLPPVPSHGLPDRSLLSSVHDLRAARNARHPLYAVLQDIEATVDQDDDVYVDHSFHHVEKKRRLTLEQVKSLEVSFELENKLEPERKNQLAQELGLQPRQVAIWFQNRRARYKAKQLEKDYDILKVEYDAMCSEKEKLQAEVARLRDLLNVSRGPCKDGGTAMCRSSEDQEINPKAAQTQERQEDETQNQTTSLQRDDAKSKQTKPQGEAGDASRVSEKTEDLDGPNKRSQDDYVPEKYYQPSAARFSLCTPQFLHQITVKLEESLLLPENMYNYDDYLHTIQDQASETTMCFNWPNYS